MANSPAISADPANVAAALGTPNAVIASRTPPRSDSFVNAATENIPARSSRATKMAICGS
ncbi:MAG TPA: hypothetical protein VMD50_09325 [Mycobacterium sp.]|nr:hypothetical protein [Mycobacterium sp.]HTY31595.1 hypothetical protein [Mycobacterium sp.]